MIKIANTIALVFLLSSFEKSYSAQKTSFQHQQDIVKRTSAQDYSANERFPIKSPTPIRFNPTLPPILEGRKYSSATAEEIKSIETHNEQVFRDNANRHMLVAHKVVLVPREASYIYRYKLTDTKMYLKDGFYQKVSFFDVFQRPIPTYVFQSLVLPLTSMKLMELPDCYGNRLLCYVPQFIGYTYKKKDGFWLWTDLPEPTR